MVKKQGINETDRIVAETIDVAGQAEDNLIRLSTGVVLTAKQANPNILIRVMTSQERPQPPMVFIKAMGREMENPNDPDYIKRVQAWEMSYNNSMLNVLVGLGTELKSKPRGMTGPDEDSWLEDYKFLGLPIHPESPSWRYITWILFKAAVSPQDIQAIGNKVKNLSGVKEADVQAAETFPGSDEESR